MAFIAADGQPEELRIHLLGDFRVCIGEKCIDSRYWRLRKAKSLIKLLALEHNHRLHREQLVDTLWPEHDLKQATDSLYQTLHNIRSVLKQFSTNPQLYVQMQNETISLCPETSLWIDVEAFEAAAKETRHIRNPATYQLALALYTGDLLPEDRYEDWANNRREALRQEHVHLLFELARLYESREEYPLAIDTYQKVLVSDPLQEEAHYGLMHAFAMAGQRPQALRQFQALKEVLRQELGAEPDPQSALLYQEIHSGRFLLPRALPSSDFRPSPRHNLPNQLSTFIGREKEIEQVKLLLTRSRLVTLTGSGGVGKTRLAIRVAEDLRINYPDGVWLVELDSLTKAYLVPYAVAGVFGVGEEKEGTVLENLKESLHTKHLLMVLDNCEHLMEASARLADILLQACPNLHILSTSREALGIKGEISYRVPSLSLPDVHNLPPVTALTRFEAVRLFIERAQTVLPSFGITEENALSIAQICQQLDGIPLALELAATRISILRVEQIAARLDDRFRLLTGGSRTALPRQQTLQASIDWSYDLLSEAEQLLFCRLSVFVGGWNLAAAEYVCADSVLQPADILDLLGQLINKSLVVVGPESGQEGRYRLLETIRQYAYLKILGTAEWASLRNRHLTYFLRYVEENEPKLRTAEQVERMDQLKTEQDNLRGALGWSLAESQGSLAAEGLRMASALLEFWEFNGLISEGYDWLKKGLTFIDRQDARWTALSAKALYAYGVINGSFQTREAIQILEESVMLYRKCEDKAGLSRALCALGNGIWYQTNQREKARLLVEEAVRMGRDAGDPACLAQALIIQACFSVDVATAREYAKGGLAIFLEMGNKWGVIDSLDILGNISIEQGDYKAVRAYSEEILGLAREGEFKRGIADAYSLLGRTAYFQNDFNQMEASFQEVFSIGRELGRKGWIIWSLRQMGIAAKRQGDYRRAATYLLECLPLAETVGDVHGIVQILGTMAGIATGTSQPGRAARLLGAEMANLKSTGMLMDEIEREEFDRDTAIAQSQLDEAAFHAAWSEGSVMTLKQAVAEAYAIGSELNP